MKTFKEFVGIAIFVIGMVIAIGICAILLVLSKLNKQFG
jgi:hypothetical protein